MEDAARSGHPYTHATAFCGGFLRFGGDGRADAKMR